MPGAPARDNTRSAVRRIRGRALPVLLVTLGVFAAHAGAAEPAPAAAADGDRSPAQLFQTHCGACHSLELPRSQRLDRSTWRWVVDDMVNKFGATWITEQQQQVIVDYLAENYGPDRPR